MKKAAFSLCLIIVVLFLSITIPSTEAMSRRDNDDLLADIADKPEGKAEFVSMRSNLYDPSSQLQAQAHTTNSQLKSDCGM